MKFLGGILVGQVGCQLPVEPSLKCSLKKSLRFLCKDPGSGLQPKSGLQKNSGWMRIESILEFKVGGDAQESVYRISMF